jgi:hypothetical protein
MAEERSWDALREEYATGSMSLGALARARGVPLNAVKRHSRAEGWVAMRREAKAVRDRSDDGNGVREIEAERSSTAVRDGAVDSVAEDVRVAIRVRNKLLLKLENATDEIPCDATEMKVQEDSKTMKLLKLRDLTAAYKDLVEDMSVKDADNGQARVIVDV